MKRKVTLQGLALLLALGTTTNVFASVKNDIKIEVVGGGDIDIYNNKEDTNSKDTLNQKEENKSIPYSQDEYQYLQINFSEPFTEERYLELINNKESFIVSDSRLASTRSTTTPIYLNSSTFPDKVLRDKLQTIFSVSSDNVDVSYKVLTTTTLRLQGDFSNTGIHITNIKGLEHFTNLTDLYLSNNKINSISSIKDLVNLETLYINGASNYGLTINFRCNIDASDLSKLVNLKTLNLSDCNITSVDKIGNLIELEDLDLASTNINNISFVSKLGELKSLDLSDVDNKLSLSPISKLINLKNLDLVNKNSSAIINTNFAQYLPKSREVIRLYVEKGANFTSYLNGHQKAYEDIDCTDSSIDWNPSSGRGVTVYVKTEIPLSIKSVTVVDKYWDNTTKAEIENVVFSGLENGDTLTKGVDYTVNATYDNSNLGSSKQVIGTINLLSTNKTNRYKLSSSTFQTTGNIIKGNSNLDNIKIKNSKGSETTTFDFSDRLIVEATPKIRANLNEMELVLNNQVISKQSATLNNKVTFNVDLSTLTIGQGNYELKLRYGGNNNVNGTEQSLGNITINKTKIKAEINESIEYNGKDTFELELKNIKNKNDDTTINGIIGSATIQLNSSNVGNYSNFIVNKVSINGDTYNHYEFENQNTDITGSANITKANIKDILAEIYVTNKLEKDYIFNLEESLPILENNKTFGNLSFSNLNYNEIVKSYLKETPIIDKNNLKLKVNKFISEEEKLLGEITLDVTSTNYNDFKLKLNLNSTNKLKPILNVYQKDTLTYGDNLKKLNLDFTATYGNEIVDGTINVNEDLESILDAGNHKISVTFIPTDNNKYDVVDGYVDIKIQKALAKVIEKPEITKITDSGKMLSESKFITKGKFQGINNEIINENDYTLKWENEDEIIIQGKPYKYNMISNNYYIIEEHTPFELSDNNNGGDNNSNNNNNNSNSSSGNNNVNNDGDYTGSGSNVVDNGNNTVNNPNTEDISNGNKEYNNTENDNLFEDLSNDHSAKNEINYLFEKGIIKGYNGLIRPNDYMTRAEFSILLNNTCKYLGVDTNNLADDSYTDVYKDKYYYNDIYKATYLDTMIGYDDGTFKPDNNMTREESIVSIYKLISLCNLDMELSYPINFNDYEQVSVWAKPYFDELNSKSILKGDNNGNFKPKDSITRAEAMVLIYGILNK